MKLITPSSFICHGEFLTLLSVGVVLLARPAVCLATYLASAEGQHKYLCVYGFVFNKNTHVKCLHALQYLMCDIYNGESITIYPV